MLPIIEFSCPTRKRPALGESTRWVDGRMGGHYVCMYVQYLSITPGPGNSTCRSHQFKAANDILTGGARQRYTGVRAGCLENISFLTCSQATLILSVHLRLGNPTFLTKAVLCLFACTNTISFSARVRLCRLVALSTGPAPMVCFSLPPSPRSQLSSRPATSIHLSITFT